jgi:hypothetical protein
MVYSARNPQGFEYRSAGETSRILKDFEGLALVYLPGKNPDKEKRKNKKES